MAAPETWLEKEGRERFEEDATGCPNVELVVQGMRRHGSARNPELCEQSPYSVGLEGPASSS